MWKKHKYFTVNYQLGIHGYVYDNKFDTEGIYFRSFHLNLWYAIDNIPK